MRSLQCSSLLLMTVFSLNVHSSETQVQKFTCAFPKEIGMKSGTVRSTRENPLEACFEKLQELAQSSSKNSTYYRVDELCDLNNAATQCRENFKKDLKANACQMDSQPVACDLEYQIRKTGAAPAKFTCSYSSTKCYTNTSARQPHCDAGFKAVLSKSQSEVVICVKQPAGAPGNSDRDKGVH